MTIPLKLITASADLVDATARLGSGARVALDTEFLRERTYVAELALVQLGDGAAVALIDPLADLDLKPLAALLCDPALAKVLHAGRQDVEVLLPLTSAPVAPLIDTQIAAALLGHAAQIGYADLVERELGQVLEKSQARTDWTRRPLTAAQLEYAADDVRWLLPLAAQLEEKLESRGRLEWLREDCRALADPELYRIRPADAWQRLKGTESLPPREQLRLRALAAWRESEALRRNLPRGWLLADDALRAIARAAPRDLKALQALDVMPGGSAGKLGGAILAELERAAGQPLEGIVQRVESRPSTEERALGKNLTDCVRSIATELGLAPEVLATQRDLKRVAHGDPPATVLKGWRAGLLAAPLDAVRARG